MGKLGGALVCLLIVAMDIIAGILGIEAEIAQNKVCCTVNVKEDKRKKENVCKFTY